MHIVILHGYILQGTGSNIYVVNIAKAWKQLGHKVTVICQERDAKSLPFVDDVFLGTPSQKLPELEGGKLRVIVPDINNLLPVFVKDVYEGYVVKTIPEMTDEEISTHIDLVANCLKFYCETQKVDKVFTNHAILNPIIAQRALKDTKIPYDVKIHGSAIEFSLVPHPELIPKWAVPGLKEAANIYAGTNHIQSRVKEVFAKYAQEIDLKNKVKVVPPGMDPDIFRLAEDPSADEKKFIEKVKQRIQQNPSGRKGMKTQFDENTTSEKLHQALVQSGKKYDQRIVDADLPERWISYKKHEPTIMYVGKFLHTKGVGQLLAMAPTLIKKMPELRFIFVGFGSYREHMQELLNAFEEGNVNKAKIICKAGQFITQINIQDYFFKINTEIRRRIVITGFLEHELLEYILPSATISVVPSKLSEAFGMVAVEAMAAGVFPICNNHSGLAEIINHMQSFFPELVAITKTKKQVFFEQLPTIIEKALKFIYVKGFEDGSNLEDLRKKFRRFSVDNYSWSKIAQRLLIELKKE